MGKWFVVVLFLGLCVGTPPPKNSRTRSMIFPVPHSALSARVDKSLIARDLIKTGRIDPTNLPSHTPHLTPDVPATPQVTQSDANIEEDNVEVVDAEPSASQGEGGPTAPAAAMTGVQFTKDDVEKIEIQKTLGADGTGHIRIRIPPPTGCMETSKQTAGDVLGPIAPGSSSNSGSTTTPGQPTSETSPTGVSESFAAGTNLANKASEGNLKPEDIVPAAMLSPSPSPAPQVQQPEAPQSQYASSYDYNPEDALSDRFSRSTVDDMRHDDMGHATARLARAV